MSSKAALAKGKAALSNWVASGASGLAMDLEKPGPGQHLLRQAVSLVNADRDALAARLGVSQAALMAGARQVVVVDAATRLAALRALRKALADATASAARDITADGGKLRYCTPPEILASSSGGGSSGGARATIVACHYPRLGEMALAHASVSLTVPEEGAAPL